MSRLSLAALRATRLLPLLALLLHGTGSAQRVPAADPAPPLQAHGSFTGTVSHVSDGDTLWVRLDDDSFPRKIRLQGIDAPEICQRHGEAARKALAQRVLRQQVFVRVVGVDDFRRGVGDVRLRGEDLGRWMVLNGHAWSYHFRRDPGPYAAEEAKARAARRGLFAEAGAEQPRAFRKRHGPCEPAPAPSRQR